MYPSPHLELPQPTSTRHTNLQQHAQKNKVTRNGPDLPWSYLQNLQGNIQTPYPHVPAAQYERKEWMEMLSKSKNRKVLQLLEKDAKYLNLAICFNS